MLSGFQPVSVHEVSRSFSGTIHISLLSHFMLPPPLMRTALAPKRAPDFPYSTSPSSAGHAGYP